MHCKPCGRGNVYFDKRLALFNFSGRVNLLVISQFGKATRLYASEAGDVNGRFSIQFNKRLDTRGGAWAYADDNGGIVVRGLIKGQMVRTYMAGGQMADSRVAAGETETVSGLEKGMYLIQVVSDGREPTVIKIRLK